MSLFYTGKGDKGKSVLTKTKNIDKTSIEVEAVGTIDELNSFIGLAKNYLPKYFQKILLEIQENLFIIQAHVGTIMMGGKFKPPIFSKNKILIAEKIIEDLENKIKPEKKFIIPGATKESAWLDTARTLSRKTERALVNLNKKATSAHKSHGESKKKGALAPESLAYLNRLSSLLYALARYAVKQKGVPEKHPSYR